LPGGAKTNVGSPDVHRLFTRCEGGKDEHRIGGVKPWRELYARKSFLEKVFPENKRKKGRKGEKTSEGKGLSARPLSHHTLHV
jgi:hypothetical protein